MSTPGRDPPRAALFADELQDPRWLYVLPNGDVLVAESANQDAASDRLRDMGSASLGRV